MFKLAKEDLLFATPLFRFEMQGDVSAFNAQLLRDIDILKKEDVGITRSNYNGWHSEPTLFRRKEKSFKDLQRFIVDSSLIATRKAAPKFDLKKFPIARMDGWVNTNGMGGMNIPHDHPGYMWSGCYYVSAPATKVEKDKNHRSGVLEFLDPRGSVLSASVPNSETFNIRIQRQPQEGVLFIFPSYVWHWVYPNEEDSERISIAFNIRYELEKDKPVALAVQKK